MVAVAPLHFPEPSSSDEDVDQRVILYGVPWDRYEAFLDARGEEHPGVRIAYLEGTLEIMTVSRSHELIKKTIARLLEAHADETGIELEGYGSTTFRKKARMRGAEPDECYAVGEMAEFPDIALKVSWTSGGIDKLSIYEGFEVPEVWFWKAGAITIHQLGQHGYEVVTKSRFLPDLDVEELVRCLAQPTQTQAVRAYREALRARLGK